MRKTLLTLAFVATAGLATPAAAQDPYYDRHHSQIQAYAPAAGVVAGTLFGLSLSEAWWGSSILSYSLPASTGAAAAAGGLVGIGTIVAIHGFTTPCQGAHAFFSGLFTSPEGCVNGQWVGRGAAVAPPRRRR